MGIPILVVDDEDTLRSVISQVLEEEGHQVTAAANGEEALAAFRANPVPLVITDIIMGSMNGLELLQQVKTVKEDVLVVIMTSQASLETATTAIRTGAYDYLVKPFDDLDVITAVVDRAIDQIQLQQKNKRLVQELSKNAEELEELNTNLRDMAIRDPLTGLFNRRYLHEAIDLELARSRRHKRFFSVVFIDVDHFKQYNDAHGHLAGDEVLKTLATIIQNGCRATTIPARYGGEEMVLLLPETEKQGARAVAEKLRMRVEEYPFPGQETQPLGTVTLSMGIATYPEDGGDGKSLLGYADQALYQAKHRGRNTICS
jgi:diguanylate cyclase (GGDEF)-like protein